MQAVSQSASYLRTHEACKACEPESANHKLSYASRQGKPHIHIGKKWKPMS